MTIVSAPPEAPEPDKKAEGCVTPTEVKAEPAPFNPDEAHRKKEELVKQENAILEKVAVIRAAQAAAVAIKQPPSKEPPRTLAHWDYLLREGRWLAEDVAQERIWKVEVAKKLAHEIATLDRKDLHHRMMAGRGAVAQSPEKDRRRKGAKIDGSSITQNGDHLESSDGVDRRSVWEMGTTSAGGEMAPSTPPATDSIFTYQIIDGAVERYFSSLEQESRRKAQEYERAVRDYEVEMERVRKLAREAAKRREEEARRSAMEAAAAEAEARRLALAREEASKARKRKKGDLLEGISSADMMGKRPGGPIQEGIIKKQKMLDGDMVGGLESGRGPSTEVVGDYTVEYVERKGKKGMVIKDKNGKVLKGAELKKAQAEVAQRQKTLEKQQAKEKSPGETIPWTKSEDNLLCAIVLEFGSNWALVADILNVHSHFQGWHRKQDSCRNRFRLLTTSEDGTPSEESIFASMNLNRNSARLLVQRSIPAEDAVLQNHIDKIGKSYKAFLSREGQEKERRKAENVQLAPAHASHLQTQNMVASTVQANVLTPQVLADMAIAMTNANLQQVGLQAGSSNPGGEMGSTPSIPGMRQRMQQVQAHPQPLHGQPPSFPAMSGFNAGLTPPVGMAMTASHGAPGQTAPAHSHGRPPQNLAQGLQQSGAMLAPGGSSSKLSHASDPTTQQLPHFPGSMSEQQRRHLFAPGNSHQMQQNKLSQHGGMERSNSAFGTSLFHTPSMSGPGQTREESAARQSQELSKTLTSKAPPKSGTQQDAHAGTQTNAPPTKGAKQKNVSQQVSKAQTKKPSAKSSKGSRK